MKDSQVRKKRDNQSVSMDHGKKKGKRKYMSEEKILVMLKRKSFIMWTMPGTEPK